MIGRTEAAHAAAVVRLLRAPDVPDTSEAAFTAEAGVFSDPTRAAALLDRLKADGFPAFIVAQEEAGRPTWYSVLVGRHATRDAAVRTAHEVQRRLLMEGRILLLMPEGAAAPQAKPAP